MRSDGQGSGIPLRSLRRDCPRSRRTSRRERRMRAGARMIEDDREILIDDGALRRVIVNLEMTVSQGQPVERLCGASHRFDRGADKSGKSSPACARRHRAGKRDRGRARIVGDRKRQRAVGGDAQAQVEPVEFKPPHPDVEHRRRERIETKFAARRRKDRSASGVAHRQAFEPQTHAPRIVHEIGGAENDGVTIADALLERGLDLVVHANQPKGPSREQRGQCQPADDEQGCDELHRAETNVRDPAGADPAPARAKARTLRIRRHAAHSGPGASPCRHAISNDQYRSSSLARAE